MKKLVLTSICTLAVAAGVFAQGTVNWALNPGDYSAQTNSTQYSPLFGGGATGSGAQGRPLGGAAGGTGGYYIELLTQAYSGNGSTVAGGGTVASPTTLAQLATWSDTGLGGTNSPSNGSGVTIGGSSQAVANNWAASSTQSVMVVEWSANLGTTFAAALASMQNQSYVSSGANAFFGESVTGYLLSGNGNPGVTVFAGSQANGNAGVPIFSQNTQLFVLPVPEPGTIAMAALGGLSLLAFRRKK